MGHSRLHTRCCQTGWLQSCSMLCLTPRWGQGAQGVSTHSTCSCRRQGLFQPGGAAAHTAVHTVGLKGVCSVVTAAAGSTAATGNLARLRAVHPAVAAAAAGSTAATCNVAGLRVACVVPGALVVKHAAAVVAPACTIMHQMPSSSNSSSTLRHYRRLDCRAP